jgi:tetratricopeptide (TPR) repeat protein
LYLIPTAYLGENSVFRKVLRYLNISADRHGRSGGFFNDLDLSACYLAAPALLTFHPAELPSSITQSVILSNRSSQTTAQVNFEELENFDYWQRLCRLQTAAGKYEEAQQACEQAIELRPEEASIWADHSGILLQLAKYPEAIASADLSLTSTQKILWPSLISAWLILSCKATKLRLINVMKPCE